jgi:hypothetical protein
VNSNSAQIRRTSSTRSAGIASAAAGMFPDRPGDG